MAEPVIISRACPSCKTPKAVEIDGYRLRCKNDKCSFTVSYCCPICDGTLDETMFSEDQHGTFFKCSSCQSEVHTKRIKYLIDNQLNVDHTRKCDLCNGPLVQRPEANMGGRCFFFPKCSGQADLFGGSKESIVFLDFETSGLDAARNYITEVGALKIDQEGFEHTFESLVKIPVPLDQKIIQITGITDDMLKDAPDLESVMKDLVEFIGDATLVAHNAEFDLPWLLMASMETKVTLPVEKVICTLKWARASSEPQGSLGALTKKYKIGHQNAHRALADAAATKEIFFIFDQMKAAPRPVESVSVYQEIADKVATRSDRLKMI
jgi:DNA polymerase III epsilon subunit family exonuclease